MKVRRNLGIIILVLSFILASACIANAAGPVTDQYSTPQAPNSRIGSDSHSSGAMRVDRDLGKDHTSDTNQFGDDRASSPSGGSTGRETDYQPPRWTPETYGLSGDYGRDEK